jgi:ferredoxin-NADP reductase/predicted pyridoxine 5'-phosphate oxidase superfamily flavin-nucleotide-binding protein
MLHAEVENDSPFHAGELQVQERLGVRDMIGRFARMAIRDHMPEQHRDFYVRLPFVMIGSVDDQGRPWASLVAKVPGFMSSPDAQSLDIGARPLFGDPLNEGLKSGADVGLLGIEPATRRRNRMTGRIGAVRPEGFMINILQTFGNCPQYIQARDIDILPPSAVVSPTIIRGGQFDARTCEIISQADTLFIATAYRDTEGAVTQGADVSHRGGKPGFVRVDDDRTFVFPDFSGNNHYNTIGNILLNPKAGFLFVDFEKRDIVYMTGSTEIVWDDEEIRAFAGAERLIRFQAEQIIRVEGSLPLEFSFGDYSPMLQHTGSWEDASDTIAAERNRNTYLPYEVTDVVPESDTISSIYLRRADGKRAAGHEPGQFLPIRVTIPGRDEPAPRTYTLSDLSDGDRYRLSVKREGGAALVSNYLHEHAKPGFRLEAMAPRGKFVLDQESDRPAVLISAGVGITPMIAMTNFIINEGMRTRKFRRTYFIHSARNGQDHAFRDHIRDLAGAYKNFTAHFRYSQPGENDRLGETHDSEGHVDIKLLKRVLPFDDYDFYLCGPGPFMQSLYEGLMELGISDERIHYESFGPAMAFKQPTAIEPPVEGEPVAVAFAKSDTEAVWTAEKGTLLDFAEGVGLSPDFSCRSGICGSCTTTLRSGEVDYVEEPSAPHGDDEILICCAVPRSTSDQPDSGVVLDL